MKKTLSLLCALLLAFSMVACGSDEEAPDADMDGVADATDNCVDVANADQANTDGDEFGNACDPFPEVALPPNCPCKNSCCDTCCAISVKGMVLDFPSMQPTAVQIATLAALNAAGPSPVRLQEAASDATGAFMVPCTDVAEEPLAIVTLSDDAAWDGTTAGDYYPTFSGVASFQNAAGALDPLLKTCQESALVFALKRTFTDGLKALPGFENIDTDGFGLVFAFDSNRAPVAGAILAEADGTPMTGVIYPDFTDPNAPTFNNTETKTWAGGQAGGVMFVPGPVSLTTIAPKMADGSDTYTWVPATFGTSGLASCFTRPFIAEAP